MLHCQKSVDHQTPIAIISGNDICKFTKDHLGQLDFIIINRATLMITELILAENKEEPSNAQDCLI
jgi:hypothetical protein